MPFCMRCGNQLSDLAIECPKCGTPNVKRAGGSTASAVPQRAFANAPLLRPLGIGEIVDVALKLYRSNAGALLKAVALVVFPVQIVSALIQSSVIPDEQAFVTSPVQPVQPGFEQVPQQVNFGPLWTMLAGFVITFALNGLASQLATATSMRAVSEAYLGEKPSWKESLDFAISKLGSLLWIGLLSFLGTVVGFLFCIIPGYYLQIMWSVAVPALLVENARGANGLRRSYQLVKSRFWPTVGVIMLGNLVAFVASLVFGLGVGALTVLGDSELVAFVGQALANSISLTITTPFLAATIAILYFDLRVRKEGFDLELLAQHVGGESVPANARAYGPPPGPGPGGYAAPPVAGQPVAGPPPAAPPPARRPTARRPAAPQGASPQGAAPPTQGFDAELPPAAPPPAPPPRRRPTKPGYTPPPEGAPGSDEGTPPPSDR